MSRLFQHTLPQLKHYFILAHILRLQPSFNLSLHCTDLVKHGIYYTMVLPIGEKRLYLRLHVAKSHIDEEITAAFISKYGAHRCKRRLTAIKLPMRFFQTIFKIAHSPEKVCLALHTRSCLRVRNMSMMTILEKHQDFMLSSRGIS